MHWVGRQASRRCGGAFNLKYKWRWERYVGCCYMNADERAPSVLEITKKKGLENVKYAAISINVHLAIPLASTFPSLVMCD
jgi:hypothetical protein